jgi:hypothetical protein
MNTDGSYGLNDRPTVVAALLVRSIGGSNGAATAPSTPLGTLSPSTLSLPNGPVETAGRGAWDCRINPC